MKLAGNGLNPQVRVFVDMWQMSRSLEFQSGYAFDWVLEQPAHAGSIQPPIAGLMFDAVSSNIKLIQGIYDAHHTGHF